VVALIRVEAPAGVLFANNVLLTNLSTVAVGVLAPETCFRFCREALPAGVAPPTKVLCATFVSNPVSVTFPEKDLA
jgi:aspartate/methionine/tyrosine aminotransferase